MSSVLGSKHRSELDQVPPGKRHCVHVDELPGILRLPLELRQQIYLHHFDTPEHAVVSSWRRRRRQSTSMQGEENQERHTLAVMFVNKQFREEVNDTLYATHALHFYVSSEGALAPPHFNKLRMAQTTVPMYLKEALHRYRNVYIEIELRSKPPDGDVYDSRDITFKTGIKFVADLLEQFWDKRTALRVHCLEASDDTLDVSSAMEDISSALDPFRRLRTVKDVQISWYDAFSDFTDEEESEKKAQEYVNDLILTIQGSSPVTMPPPPQFGQWAAVGKLLREIGVKLTDDEITIPPHAPTRLSEEVAFAWQAWDVGNLTSLAELVRRISASAEDMLRANEKMVADTRLRVQQASDKARARIEGWLDSGTV